MKLIVTLFLTIVLILPMIFPVDAKKVVVYDRDIMGECVELEYYDRRYTQYQSLIGVLYYAYPEAEKDVKEYLSENGFSYPDALEPGHEYVGVERERVESDDKYYWIVIGECEAPEMTNKNDIDTNFDTFPAYEVIKTLNITKEQFEKAVITSGKNVPQEAVDMLFSGDEAEIKKYFKYDSIFYCEEDGYLYNLLDLMVCDEETLLKMNKNGALTDYLEYMLNDFVNVGDVPMMQYWDGRGYRPYYAKYGNFLIDTLELMNPTKEYSVPAPYDDIDPAPQTGFATYAYAAVAVVAAAGAVAVVKRRRTAV